MDVLIKPRLEEEKKKLIQQSREDTTEAAITAIRAKIKEQMDAEAAAREAEGGWHYLTVIGVICSLGVGQVMSRYDKAVIDAGIDVVFSALSWFD